MKNFLQKDVLYEYYVTQRMTIATVAQKLNVSVGSVYNYLNLYGIETRKGRDKFIKKRGKMSPEKLAEFRAKWAAKGGKHNSEETKRKISEANKLHGIGHKKKRRDGYIAVFYPDHPKSTKDGFIMEHRLVMESIIGRHIKENECVHHINHIRDDNRPENLKLMTKHDHMSYHMKKIWEEKRRNDLSII